MVGDLLSRISLARFALIAPAAMALVIAAGRAEAQPTIIGGLGNFDCPNEDEPEDECDGFEIELEGPHQEDVIHTYCNPNYGSPTVSNNASGTGVRIVYANPHYNTPPHMIEHFGVSLRNMGAITAQRFQWHHVNAVQPPPIAVPTLDTQIIDTGNGLVMRQTITNIDTYQRSVWVIRREQQAIGEVTLEELTAGDPLVESSNDLDFDPVLLPAGASLVFDQPVSVEDGGLESDIFSYQIFKNRRVWNGWGMQDVMDVEIGNMMTAALATASNCGDVVLPTFTKQPKSVNTQIGGEAELKVAVDADPSSGALNYQWRHEGVDMPGQDGDTLDFKSVTWEDRGSYTCVVWNDCGRMDSLAAQINIAPPCVADVTYDGVVDLADFFEFFNCFDATDGCGNIDGQPGVDLGDFFAFLNHFDQGC